MRVVVTGCSSGIGRATARELACRGHEVVATARRPETLAELDVAERMVLDVDSQSSVDALFAQTGRVDAVVNNAGTGVRGPIEAVPLEEVQRMFNTNFFGAVRVMQAVLPAMRERGSGTLVNVTSIAAHFALPLHGFYSASKFALQAVTEAARLELGHFGVRVLAVAPGFVESGWVNREYGLDGPPYGRLEEMVQQSSTAIDDVNGGAQQPAMVANVIADAIESDDTKLVWPAGSDAEMTIGAREGVGYLKFETAMRDLMKLDW
jgi:NAD(P)-dependent dehydrogenase (short-subunit alcohol dehydrogenase family)